ncbi:DUF397 domain-containing protein [Streptomyces sp. NPDC059003]|uniref:DUF397 domain-containing protein n=1 Tax=Streptomyces sp. NPDC059003 TaxID=3346691 RepID=UPI0036A3F61E
MWRKSSYSGSPQAECVEFADMRGGPWVRDSKRPDGPHVVFSSKAWGTFTANLQQGPPPSLG